MRTIDIRKSNLTGPVVVILVLGLLYWLDTVHISWRRQAFQTFDTEPFFYFMIALLILFSVLVIFLAWLLLVYSRPSWVTIIFCLLAGNSILAISRPFDISVLNQSALSGLLYVIYSLESASVTLQAGAFVLVIGLVGSVRIILEKTHHENGTK